MRPVCIYNVSGEDNKMQKLIHSSSKYSCISRASGIFSRRFTGLQLLQQVQVGSRAALNLIELGIKPQSVVSQIRILGYRT